MAPDYFESMKSTEFDNSKIRDYLSCPAKFYLRWMRKLRQDESVHLAYGTAVHAMLECYYRERRDGVDKPDAFVKAYRTLEEANFTAVNSKTFDTAIELLTQCMERPELQGDIAGVERVVRRPLGMCGHTQMVYIGKIDLLLQTNNGYKVIDHKTAGRLTTTFIRNVKVNRQVIGYMFLTGAREGILNMLHCVAKPAVEPIPLRLSQPDIDRWQRETLSICNDIFTRIQQVAEDSEMIDACFPRSGSSCVDGYGCDYDWVCKQSSSLDIVEPLDEVEI